MKPHPKPQVREKPWQEKLNDLVWAYNRIPGLTGINWQMQKRIRSLISATLTQARKDEREMIKSVLSLYEVDTEEQRAILRDVNKVIDSLEAHDK